MDEDAPHQRRWPRVAARVIGTVVVAVGLYVLSVGPAVYVCAGTNDRFVAFYSPLIWLVKHAGTSAALGSYVSWWLNLPGRPGPRTMPQSTPLPASQVPSPAAPIP